MKTMKKIKSILTAVLCLMLLVPFTNIAAADETFEVTVNTTEAGHVYEAYQIFSGKLAEVDGKQILSDIQWGSSIVKKDKYDYSTALLDAIKAESKLSALHAADSAAKLATLISGNITSDSETMDLLAKVIGEHLGDVAKESTFETTHYLIDELSAGYYLIKDNDDTLTGADTVHTKYIVRVVKSVPVTPKGEKSTLTKTINDTVDGTYGEFDDFDTNDLAYFKLQGTLPSNLKFYEKYYYKYVDTFPEGLDFYRLEAVYVEGSEGNVVHTFFDLNDTDTSNDVLPNSETAYIRENLNGKEYSLEMNDLFKLYPGILPTHKVVVKVSARVTRDAKTQEAMTNKAYLEFSNDPYSYGDGDYGRTPEDVAHAFTFKIDIDKYDSDNKAKKLPGAQFVIYYERAEGDQTVKYYAKIITEETIYNFDEEGNKTLKPEEDRLINGKPVDENDLGIVYGYSTNIEDAGTIVTDDLGYAGIRGIDTGIYYLKETVAPAGYNLMETPVQVKIVAAYSKDGSTVDVKYEVDSEEQISPTVGVRNSSGSMLPVTGGMGTTLFYVLGSGMVLAAAVLLVSKKRYALKK